MTSKNDNDLINFLFESGQLKRVKRSGFWLAGVKDPESVAEHSYRAAVVGYFLAKLEGVDCCKVALMCLFNDIHETRINDLHKVGHKYIDFRAAEKKVYTDQAESLGSIGEEMFGFLKDFSDQNTKESIVARDADLLENALTAKEYIDIGYKDCQNWIDNIWKVIKLDSSKRLLKIIETANSQGWYKELKKIER